MLRVVVTINLFQGTPTSISAPAASNLSAEMQRGGKWWIETLRSGSRRVAQLREGSVAPQFLLDRSDRSVDRSNWYSSRGFMQAGLTGCMDRSD